MSVHADSSDATLGVINEVQRKRAKSTQLGPSPLSTNHSLRIKNSYWKDYIDLPTSLFQPFIGNENFK
jgi:hypothetical protein